MLKKIIVPLSIAVGLVTTNVAFGLGLGRMQVNSYLEDPLDVKVSLNPDSSDDLNTLSVKVATNAQFKSAGITKQSLYDSLNFEVVKGPSPYVRITSSAPLNEPFLHLLLDFNWNSGQLLREYTALIDPPVYASKSQPVAQPLAPSTKVYSGAITSGATTATQYDSIPLAQTFPLDVGGVQNGASFPAYETVISEPVYTQSVSGTIGYTDEVTRSVVAGDSLSMIAKSIQDQYPELSIYQIMYVLFRDNPDAFLNNNINQLVKGSVLKSSSINDMVNTKKSDGQALFFSHLSNLAVDDYAVNAVQGFTTGVDESIESISSTIEEESQAFKVGGADADNSSAVQGSDQAKKQVTALKQELSDAVASLEAAKLENVELQERVSVLEELVADTNRQLEIESESAKELVEQIKRNEETAVALAKEADLRAATEAAAEAEKNKAVEAVNNTVDSVKETVAVETPVITPEKIEEPIVAATEVVKDTTKKLTIMDYVQDNILPIGGGLAALLAGILALVVSRRKNKAEIGFEDTFTVDTMNMPSQDVAITEEDFRTTETTITKESSFLTVYSDSEVVVHADEIDPIAEADVYIAYGRDEQGEEVLVEGMRKFPNRPDIKLSLLKLYLKRKDVSKFDSMALQLKSDGHNDNPEIWDKVSEMGSALSPDNPIYGKAGLTAPTTEPQAEVVDDAKPNLGTVPVAATAAATAAIAAAATEAKSILGDETTQDFSSFTENNSVEDDIIDLDLDNTLDFEDVVVEELELNADDLLEVENLNSVADSASIDAELSDATFDEVQSIDPNGDLADISNEDFTVDINIEKEELSAEVLEFDADELSVDVDLSGVDLGDVGLEDVASVDVGLTDAASVDVDSITIEEDILEFDKVEEESVLDVDLLDPTLTMDTSFPEPSITGSGADFEDPLSIQLDDVTLDVSSKNEVSDPATQLELAKVFLELDDTNGAKEILETLTNVGDADIKAEVVSMLKKITG